MALASSPDEDDPESDPEEFRSEDIGPVNKSRKNRKCRNHKHLRKAKKDGGEAGIRTLGTLTGTYAFQAYPIGRSGTSPPAATA